MDGCEQVWREERNMRQPFSIVYVWRWLGHDMFIVCEGSLFSRLNESCS